MLPTRREKGKLNGTIGGMVFFYVFIEIAN